MMKVIASKAADGLLVAAPASCPDRVGMCLLAFFYCSEVRGRAGMALANDADLNSSAKTLSI
jgi:hypothetical protein